MGDRTTSDQITIQADDAPPRSSEQPPATPASTSTVDPTSASNLVGYPPITATTTAGTNTRFFSADDIERVRKEEKDKLYSRIEEMQTELKAMREAEEARKRVVEEDEARKAEEQRKAREEEMTLKELLAQKEQEWNERLQRMEEERSRERAILEQERRFNQLQEYRRRRVDEEAENIMPELRDMVSGNSEEEIEQSLSTLKERTARILEQVAGIAQNQRQQLRGTAPTGIPPAGPIEENDQGHRTLTAADISGMDINEYAKNRDRLLGAVSRRAREGGLYG